MEIRNPRYNRAGTIDVDVSHPTLGWIPTTVKDGPIFDAALSLRPAAYVAPAETPRDPKLVGVEFGGVMCSATGADQAGLMAVLLAIQLQGEAFRPTRFHFDNGNSLVITLANYEAFMAAWMPFRQSFFLAV
jgi:hypothetical protein